MKNRRGLLQLEGLTERIVPAVSIRAVDGDLVISGIHNTGGQGLDISVSGPNEVTITDGTKVRGQYAVSGDLILNLSNRADTVTIDFAATGTLDGGITANLGNGLDTLTITTSGDGNAVISGAIVVDGGNGNDSLIITNDGTTSTLSIDGAVTFNGQAGSDTISINGTGAAIQPIVIGNGFFKGTCFVFWI